MGEHKVAVLIVDDERFFREAIREILEAEGFGCRECSEGSAALELAGDGEIGVVILDVRLPGIDGIEVLERLRELRPALQVIMLSASTDQELVLEALRLGACDYLAKPLHDEELVLAVRRAAGSHAARADREGLQIRLECLADRIEALGFALAAESGDRRDDLLRQGAVDIAADVLEAGKTSLMLLSADGDELRVAAVHGRTLAPEEMDPVAVGEGVAGRALERAQAEWVADVEADQRFAERPACDRYDSPSFAIAPLAVGESRFGVLCATDRAGGGDFADEDLCLLRLLAMQIAELLNKPANAPAAESAPESAEIAANADAALEPADQAGSSALDAELARLVCDAVVSEVEPQRVIRALLGPLARSLEADPVALYLIDRDSGTLRIEGQSESSLRPEREELPLDCGLCAGVAQTGLLVASNEPTADPRFDASVDTPQDGVAGPLLCVPLRLRSKVVGVFRAFPQRQAAISARTGEVLSAALSAAVRSVLLYRSLIDSIEEVAAARRDARPGPS